ncbi:hypothetical protein BS78_04G020800 [Paspalum vaginatum]|nr:hypothetical protein BS78_04G020800 [Paspalum vaginatum]
MEVGVVLPPQLPPPAARFQRSADRLQHTVMSYQFHLLGATLVVCIDDLRRTLIYDVTSGAIRAGPTLRGYKSDTLAASVVIDDGDVVVDGLYVLDHIPRRERRHCFEALLYDHEIDDWACQDLPQPPYVHDPGHGAAPRVRSVAVAGAHVWTYTEGAGTYSFDTARGVWRKEGGWALPFRRSAVHVPGCSLWFGVSSADHAHLCAVDLATATELSPPEVRAVWEDFRPPTHWVRRSSAVVHLGGRKLCTLRFFGTEPTDDKPWRTPRGNVLVVTAVEVQAVEEPGSDGGSSPGIRMLRRRSTCIQIPDYNSLISHVL